jgi:hypothetical protein
LRLHQDVGIRHGDEIRSLKCSREFLIPKDFRGHDLEFSKAAVIAAVVGSYLAGTGYSGVKSLFGASLTRRLLEKAKEKVGIKLEDKLQQHLSNAEQEKNSTRRKDSHNRKCYLSLQQ